MVKTRSRLVLDINKETSDILVSKQGDSLTRYIDIELKDNALPIDLSGCRIRFYAIKSDKKVIFNEAEITDAKKGRCQVPLTDQALAVSGLMKAEISIFSEDAKQVLSTKIFNIQISAMIRNDKALVSTNEYGALVILMQELKELQDEINAWHKAVNEKFEKITTEQVTEWEDMRQEQKDEFREAMDAMETWMSDITNDLNKLQVFDFDNIAALDWVRKTTEFGDGVITSTIVSRYNGLKIAEQVIVFNADDSIKTTITVYDRNGINIFKKATMNTSFGDNKIVTESEGFNDYTMTPDLSNETDGGYF